MQVAGKLDDITSRITGLMFVSHTFEDEQILSNMTKALFCEDVRFEVFVEGDFAFSFQIGSER